LAISLQKQNSDSHFNLYVKYDAEIRNKKRGTGIYKKEEITFILMHEVILEEYYHSYGAVYI